MLGRELINTGARDCVQGHSVYVMDRGGERRIAELLDLTEVRWSRELDRMSKAFINISGRSCSDQLSTLAKIEPRRHELAIFRGDKRVWEGPIISAERGYDSVTISAHDMLEYLNGTVLSKYWPSPEGGGPELMGDRIEEIIQHELTVPYTMSTFESGSVTMQRWEQLDPPINLLPYFEVRVGSVLTRSETLPFEMTLGEHLTALGRSGMDYTTIGRKLLVWDSADAIGRTRTVTLADLNGRPTIYSSGDDLRVIQHVTTQPDDELPPTDTSNTGTSGAPDPYYGVWTHLHTRSDEDSSPSQAALNTQARRLAYGMNPVPEDIVVPRGSSIVLDESLTIDNLVAGVEVPVLMNLNGREMNRVQRLVSLTVRETAAGEAITADISSTSVEGA